MVLNYFSSSSHFPFPNSPSSPPPLKLSPDPAVAGGVESAEPEATSGMHAASQSGGHERRSESGRRDGRHPGPGGGVLHQV